MKKRGKFNKIRFLLYFSVVFLALGVLNFPLCAKSLTYNLSEDFFDFGGGYGTSTNYILTDDIGNPIEYISHYVAPPPVPPNNPDTTPPVISSVQASGITTTSAVITWTTDEPATSYVNYGLTTSYGGTVGSSLTVLLHSVTLTGLNPSTLYHFRVRSTDASTNESVSGDYTFQTLTPPDTTPPIISNVAVSDVTDTSVKISWQTNESADSLIDYGLTTSYSLAASSTSLVTAHSFDLAGLSRGTVYHFRITSKDAAGNPVSTSDLTFQTTDSVPPVISNLSIVDITSTSAKVSWQTDEAADSKVDYGLTASYELGSIIDGALNTTHLIPLTGLLPNTQYHVRVHSKDASNNESISSDKIFQTLKDAVSPTNVSNFTVTAGDSLNLLNWVNPTDFDFAGVLIKRSTTGYPLNSSEGLTVFNGIATSYADSGLINGTTYYYTAFAYDTSGNFASGAMALGTPTAPPPPPPPPPPPEEVPPPPPPPTGEVPPEVPPGIPPGVPPPAVIIPEVLPLENFDFYLVHRAIQVFPDKLSQITNLFGGDVSIIINRDKFIVTPEFITLNVGDFNYFFSSSTARYEADFQVPDSPGEYSAIITVFYAQGRAIQTSFKLIVQPLGLVFQKVEGERVGIPGAKVTLYSQSGGGWQVWDGSRYFQENPKAVSEGGLYGFVVPNGTYYLLVENKGFRTRETDRFEITNNVINQNIELFSVPPSLEEVIKPEAPLSENIKNVAANLAEKSAFAAKVAAEQVVDIVQNPVVEKANEQVAVPTIVTVTAVNTVAATNVFNLWAYLQYLFMQPLILLRRRKRLGWGVVYNSLSKLPIDLSIIRLINQNTGRVIQTRVTDKEGRYQFMPSPGLYRLEVTKRGFVFPTVYLRKFKEDHVYADLYHGEPIEIKEKGAVITANIPLDPIEEKPSKARLIWQQIFKGIQYGFSIAGIILAGVSVVISPGIYTYVVLAVQILLFLLFLRLAKPPKPKGWGIVYDKSTGKPLRQAVVRIFETQFDKLLGSQVTDAKGRYSFLTGRNIYYVTSDKEGYEPAKTPKIDLRYEKKVELIAPDIPMAKESQSPKKREVKFGDSTLDFTD
jgi:hypothetical protein